jgi:NADH-quinone oxidoreductase subunit F
MNGSAPRVLPEAPVRRLADYLGAGGGRGLDAARKLGPAAVIDEVDASGLRGRGGAGFPTGVKWRTVAGYAANAAVAPTVVVNGAEGEPGTFKDRAILRANPFAVVEGALVAAFAVGADRIVFALKETFGGERERLAAAIAEMEADDGDWFSDANVGIVAGPSEYLYGEETGLLEVLEGRPPFPRVAPPFRHGIDEVVARGGGSGADADHIADEGEAAGLQLAQLTPGGSPPTLVNNLETIANVPGVLAEGADWFRQLGTAQSPGTIVCTVSGAVVHAGVGEIELGTPLGDAIELIGGGPRRDRQLVAALSGVANPIVPAARFGTPITYEDMQAIGSGMGSAGFIVFDDRTDLAAVAAGVSRFLAVESCGQCTPCKQDGLELSRLLARVCDDGASEHDLIAVADLVSTVADEARCSLALQHQQVVGSILRLFPEAFRAHVAATVPASEPEPILPLRDVVVDEAGESVVELDIRELRKQPDWSYDATDSGKSPVDRLR